MDSRWRGDCAASVENVLVGTGEGTVAAGRPVRRPLWKFKLVDDGTVVALEFGRPAETWDVSWTRASSTCCRVRREM